MKAFIFYKGLVLLFFFVLTQGCGVSSEGINKKGKDREYILSQLDIAPNEDQVDYAPADGGIVKVNPPPFTWLPVNKKITYPPDYVEYSGPKEKIWMPFMDYYTYTLQISQDRQFTSGVITRKGIDISTVALEESMQPGEWFWRYGVEYEDTIYSKTRSFTIPSKAKKWPFPADIKKVINSIPKSHPRLFIQQDELASYRDRALNGDLKNTISAIKMDIDKHIGEILPKESKFVKGIGPEFGEHSWRLIYDANIPPIDLAEKFGLVYLLTGDKTYGEEARRRVVHFSRWDPNGPTSNRSHNETSYRIVDQCSRAYDWTYELFTPEERETVKKSIKRRAEQLYNRLKYHPEKPYHVFNRGSHEERITGFLGQVAVCFADEWEEAEEWLKYVLTIHWNLYPAWGKDDGAWHQGPSYWTAYQSRVLHFITAMKKATGIDLIQKDFFQNTPYFILYTNPPYAKFSPFGDGEHNPPGSTRAEMLYNYSSILKDPYLRWYSDYLGGGHANNILGVLLKDDDLQGKPPTDLPQSRYFPGVGLVSLHTDFGDAKEDRHFLFHSDPYGGVSHGHPDQNAFTIEAFGEALAIASGYYPWYGSDHHKNWQRQTKSSNSITINGWQGQKGEAAAKGKVVLFENRDIYDYVLGDATQAYMGLLNKFQRHIIHIRPGVYVIFDDLEAPEPVTFEFWLHALSEMKINKPQKSLVIAEGNARLQVKFIQSEDLNFDQFTGFPDPPEVRGENTPEYKNNWHLTASTVLKSTKGKFITVLVPYKEDQKRNITYSQLVEEDNKVSMELSIDGKKYYLSLMPKISVEEVSL